MHDIQPYPSSFLDTQKGSEKGATVVVEPFYGLPPWGLTSFITERSKQERCHRFDAVDRAKEKQSPFENRLFGDVSRGTAALTLRPLPALRLMAQTRDMIARAGKPPGPRTAENNQV